MRADLLTLRDFRNYAFAELPLCGGVNVLCGENAQGKTNALEAVSSASRTSPILDSPFTVKVPTREVIDFA